MNSTLEWQNCSLNYLESINKILMLNPDSQEKYYGFEVIDGKLIENPEILFIGINPGSGNGEKHFDIKFSTERISYLDVYSEDYKYTLAKETISVFKLMGFTDDQIIDKFTNKCVKTNLYNIITRTQEEIKTSFENTEISFNSFYEKSTFFCVKLIKLLKPKIVIFEGKSVYDIIIQDCFEVFATWNKETNMGHFYSENDNIHYTGYSRTFSNINSKENFAKKLKEIYLINKEL